MRAPLPDWLILLLAERAWFIAAFGALVLLAGYRLFRRGRRGPPEPSFDPADPAGLPHPVPTGHAPRVPAAADFRTAGMVAHAEPPWAAKTVVSPALATALIREQFPDLAPVRVAPFGVGWDNTAYLVNDTHVFRFPRRDIAVPLLETEVRLLPAIAPRLPLPVPIPDHVGRPSRRYAWPFVGYRVLPGHTADRAQLGPDQRLAAAEILGRFLAALHAIPVDEALALGAAGDTIGRLDLGKKIPEALDRLARLPSETLGVPAAEVRAVIEASARIRAPALRVLAHGDFYSRHLLVDAAGAPCGVIDWGDLHVGDPAVDLSLAYGFLPPAGRPRFLQAYGRRVAAPTWWLARFRAVFSALAILDYGRETGDADLEREGRVCLGHAVAGS